jgi:hypothetical protein
MRKRAAKIYGNINLGVECIPAFVTKENIDKVLKSALYKDSDMFSLDIDGNDYYIAEAIMNTGFRPKIVIVEYNSALGPHDSVIIPYQENFNFIAAHPTQLYYGVSISAWRKFFARYGYSFVTVESNGVNAFSSKEASSRTRLSKGSPDTPSKKTSTSSENSKNAGMNN